MYSRKVHDKSIIAACLFSVKSGAGQEASGGQKIVGSIAGDDTIMVAIRTKEDTQAVMKKITAVLEG